MTENNYDKLKDAICELVNIAEDATSREVFEILDNAGVDVIDCLDKLSGYEAIGTIEEFKALKEKNTPKELAEEYDNDVCEWKQHEREIDVYFTECGQAHIFVDGNPEENNYEYCPYCGKKIKIVGNGE